MGKFKVGDPVIAKSNNRYRITNENAGVMVITEVLDYGDNDIRVRVLNGKHSGIAYDVESRYFKLAEFAKTELYRALDGWSDEV